MTKKIHCPLCEIAQTDPGKRIIKKNEHAYYIQDAYPVSEGHALIVPFRHVGSFFETTTHERIALFALLHTAKSHIESTTKPDGYNIGINDGVAAGQTIAHLHLHLIPRHKGDVKDPRGGLRWIMPEKADYWSQHE